jgi:hypothetical protein
VPRHRRQISKVRPRGGRVRRARGRAGVPGRGRPRAEAHGARMAVP